MKTYLNILLLTWLGFVVYACNPCKNVDCDNGGYCESGECLCEKWYSGEHCSLFFNRNYEGTYIGLLDSLGSRSEAAQLEILADSEIPNRLLVETGIYMEFENDSQLVIPTQLLEVNSDTIPIQGEGTFKNDILSFQYSNQYSTRSVLFSFFGKKTSVN